jgi:hypothetical protein
VRRDDHHGSGALKRRVWMLPGESAASARNQSGSRPLSADPFSFSSRLRQAAANLVMTLEAATAVYRPVSLRSVGL